MLANLGSQPVRDYRLSAAGGWPAGAPDELLAGHAVAAPEPLGEAGYRPLGELAPATAYLLRWPEG